MTITPENTEMWSGASVLVAPLGSTIPATENDPWSNDWEYAGALSPDAGLPFERSQEKTDHYAWGQVLLRTSKRNWTLRARFSALEGGSTVVAGLAWPGSDLASGKLKVPHSERILVAFELDDDQFGKKVRYVSEYQVEIELVGTTTHSENNLTVYEFEVTFFPNANSEVLRRIPGWDAPTLTSIAITGDAGINVGDIAVLTATATYSDSSTRDVTASAEWSTSDDGVASIPHGAGYAHGVSDGVATISATYGDQDDDHVLTVSP